MFRRRSKSVAVSENGGGTVRSRRGYGPSTVRLPVYLRDIVMAETKAFNIPYRSKLTERIEPGQTLIIRGTTIEESKRFNINLHKDSPDFSGNDVPLHLSIRFDEGKIVYNAYTKGTWGKEERAKNPIKKGEAFDIRIRAHDSKFQVSINHKEVKNFEHRIPLNSVSHLSIDGDVILNHVQWGGKYYPVPYESGIAADGLVPGKTLVVYGTPEKKAKKFNINLLKKNGDIALHFNPRFDEKGNGFMCAKPTPGKDFDPFIESNESVVRNSLVSGEWGNEEREGKNPFERLIGFDLEIRNEEFAFQIFVNGERFASYAHRVDPHDIAGLQIQGDIELTGIQVVSNQPQE
uniref:Galectin n=1 Tax=Caenorhabditis japonica TaxID=281687 RepID=A0A8R1DZK0_CAEJA